MRVLGHLAESIALLGGVLNEYGLLWQRANGMPFTRAAIIDRDVVISDPSAQNWPDLARRVAASGGMAGWAVAFVSPSQLFQDLLLDPSHQSLREAQRRWYVEPVSVVPAACTCSLSRRSKPRMHVDD